MIEAFRSRLSRCPNQTDFKAAVEMFLPEDRQLAAE